MTASTTQERVSHRVPLWRDVVVLKWVTQVVLLFVVLGTMWFLASQAGDNLRARNINTDFDFLERPVAIQISEPDRLTEAIRPSPLHPLECRIYDEARVERDFQNPIIIEVRHTDAFRPQALFGTPLHEQV